MSETIDVHEFIKKELRPDADELLRAHPAQTDKLKSLLFALPEDIKKKNERTIRLHVKELKAVIAELANHLSRTARLLEKLEDLEPDESFMKNRAEVEKLTAELSELERKVNKNYGIAKGELDKAEDALEADEAETDASEMTEEWAVTEAWMRKHLEIAKGRLDKLSSVQDTARKALEARDVKALADAGKASAAIVDAKPELQAMLDDYETACKKCDTKKLTKEQQDQLARDRNIFDKIAEEIGGINAKLFAMGVVIEGLEIKAVDWKKAAALFDIPSALEGKFKKALESDSAGIPKALDSVGKELNPKMTGKAMFDALKKAKLL